MNLRIGIVIQEILIIVCPDFFGHLLDCTCHSRIGRELEQVADIARPAAEVGSALIAGVICHVHCAEHMRKIDLIPVGYRESLQAAQSNGICSVGCVLLGHITGKGCIFRTAEGRPCAGCVFFHATTNVVNDKRCSILAGMFPGVSVGISLEGGQ